MSVSQSHPLPRRPRIAVRMALALALGLSGCEAPVHLHPRPVSAAGRPSAGGLVQQAWSAWRRGDRAAYNQAVALLFELATRRGSIEVPGVLTEWRAGRYSPGYFDRIEAVPGAKVTGLLESARVDGWGVPLVGFRKNRHVEPIERFYPPEGISRPLTAVLEMTIGRPPRLVILDPWTEPVQTVGDRRLTLSADYSAAYARLLERAQRGLSKSAYNGFTTSKGLGRDPGVFLLEPYDPTKIPVIMVHGLLSSPLIWKDMTNDIWADPELRARYQVWHYFYPTNFPFLPTASVFRNRLAETRRFFGCPSDSAGPLNRGVILAHSMGGLVARPLVTSSGYRLWDAGFRVRPERLPMDRAELALLRDYFVFEPEPSIRRVIFMAVPHRGSKLADTPVGLLGRSLVHLPKDYLQLFRDAERAAPGSLKGPIAEFAHGHASSIRVLSSKTPVRDAMADLPISPRVTFHSIMGSNRAGVPKERSTDGIVPYSSSHLDGAASELVIRSGHDEPHRLAAVVEVRRILKSALTETKTTSRPRLAARSQSNRPTPPP